MYETYGKQVDNVLIEMLNASDAEARLAARSVGMQLHNRINGVLISVLKGGGNTADIDHAAWRLDTALDADFPPAAIEKLRSTSTKGSQA